MNKIRNILALTLIVLLLSVSCAGTSKSIYTPPKKNVTVSIGLSTLIMRPGETRTFNPTFKNAEVPPALIWTSSDESIISVSQDGTVIAHNETSGSLSAQITAAIADNPNMKSVCTITVLSPSQVHFLTAGPGEDASTQAVISWHSVHPKSSLVYADTSDPADAKEISLEGEPTISEWADLSFIYRYKVTLSDLTPDSTYSYYVLDEDGNTSETSFFKTAGTDGTFSFAWLSDVHASSADSMKNTISLLDYMKDRSDISFCLYTGDYVNQGQRYRYWESWTDSGLLSRMSYAFLIGNHEYYPNNTPETATPSYYLDFAAIPDNHGSSAPADYWFIYDNVLFICLDSMAADFAEGNRIRDRQLGLIKTAISEAWEDITYIIVAQHYAFLDGNDDGTGKYSYWYQAFDNVGIDLALSSDTHAYSRSKTLFDDHEDLFGTVYVTSPKTDGKELSEIVSDDEKLGFRSAFNSAETVTGGCYIDVTPTEMTLHLIGKDGIEYDRVVIPARR